MTAARIVRLAPVLCFATGLVVPAQSADTTKAAPTHVMLQESDLAWGSGPPSLPPGQMIAVLSGDPGQAGPVTLRAKVPAGYRIPPHWHPTDEHVTVLAGTIAMGMGEKFDPSALHEMKAGGFARMPATERHFFVARTDAVIQLHGMGPLVVNYVDPADDPRNAAKK